MLEFIALMKFGKYNETQWNIDSHIRWLKSEKTCQNNNKLNTLSSGLFFFCIQGDNLNTKKIKWSFTYSKIRPHDEKQLDV